jgi:hypothetical protein
MENRQGIGLAVVALGTHVVIGAATFAGFGLMLFMAGKDLLGWGDGRSIGYLFLCVGLSLSILGVLLMRIFRNRGLLARR